MLDAAPATDSVSICSVTSWPVPATRLPEALALADAVVIGPVNRAQLLGESERMSPQAIAEATTKLGKPARAFESTPELADYLAAQAKTGDMVMIMSNGSFDGLSGKLLEKFKLREQVVR